MTAIKIYICANFGLLHVKKYEYVFALSEVFVFLFHIFYCLFADQEVFF